MFYHLRSPYSISSSAIASICTITPNTVVSIPTTAIITPTLLIKSIVFLSPLAIHPLGSLVRIVCHDAQAVGYKQQDAQQHQ